MRIDCSKSENFIRERARMCDSYRWGCADCDLAKATWCGSQINCRDAIARYPQRAIRAVQAWSDAHPRNYISYKDVYLKRYPGATLIEGNPPDCVSERFHDGLCEERYECWQCWEMPYQGEEMKEVIED